MIKPCPFCKSEEIGTAIDYSQGMKWGNAICLACGAKGPEVRTEYKTDGDAPWRKDALDEWNKREDVMENNYCQVPTNNEDYKGIYEYLSWHFKKNGLNSACFSYLEILYEKAIYNYIMEQVEEDVNSMSQQEKESEACSVLRILNKSLSTHYKNILDHIVAELSKAVLSTNEEMKTTQLELIEYINNVRGK